MVRDYDAKFGKFTVKYVVKNALVCNVYIIII